MTTTTPEPRTVNGWYEHEDGTFGHYVSASPGRPVCLETRNSPLTREQEKAEAEAEIEAHNKWAASRWDADGA